MLGLAFCARFRKHARQDTAIEIDENLDSRSINISNTNSGFAYNYARGDDETRLKISKSSPNKVLHIRSPIICFFQPPFQIKNDTTTLRARSKGNTAHAE